MMRSSVRLFSPLYCGCTTTCYRRAITQAARSDKQSSSNRIHAADPSRPKQRTAITRSKRQQSSSSSTNSWKFFNSKPRDMPEKSIMLVAIELSNPENVGGLIRVAGSADCERVIFTGDEKNFKRSKIKSTATSGYNNVNWEFCSEQGWPDKIPDGYTIIGVETCPDATNIYETELPSDKVAFVVGNESFGISEWSLERCNQIVYMPMPGIVKSLNVSQAATLAMFEWWRRVYSEQ